MDMNEILRQRLKTYGSYETQAKIAANIKNLFTHATHSDVVLKDAWDMIATKMARIANGEPRYVDSWADIAGYALLAVEHIKQNDLKPSDGDCGD